MGKKIVFYGLLLCVWVLLVLVGCSLNLKSTAENKEKVVNENLRISAEEEKKFNENLGISAEEKKRVDLYLTAMRAAYQEENGGDDFIAVKLDTLAGLSDEGKKLILEGLKDLSPCVYNFEEVKGDPGKFQYDEQGRKIRTIDGSLLYIDLKEYKGNKAVITAVSWFGNLGAVLPEYEAIFIDGHWQLNLLKMAIS